MNAFETNFKVGTRVKVYNPYGSCSYEDVVKEITPKGMYIKVGDMRYKPVGKDCATRISRWGMGTIRIV